MLPVQSEQWAAAAHGSCQPGRGCGLHRSVYRCCQFNLSNGPQLHMAAASLAEVVACIGQYVDAASLAEVVACIGQYVDAASLAEVVACIGQYMDAVSLAELVPA